MMRPQPDRRPARERVNYIRHRDDEFHDTSVGVGVINRRGLHRLDASTFGVPAAVTA